MIQVNHFYLVPSIVQIFAGTELVKRANLLLTVLKTVHTVETDFVKLREGKMFLPVKQIVELVVIRFVKKSSKTPNSVQRIVVLAVMMCVM